MGAHKRIQRALKSERRALEQLGGDEETGQSIVSGLRAWAEAAVAAGVAQRVSAGIRHVALHPRYPVPVDPAAAPRMAENVLAGPFVELALAEEFARRLDGAMSRLQDLLSLMNEATLSAAAADYLSRAGALHLWGFEKESYAVARSTLDAALADRLQSVCPEDEQGLRLQKASDRIVLNDRILLAGPHHLGLLEQAQVKLAHKIRKDGNNILHVGTPVELNFSSATAMLRALREILVALFPPESV